jgi:hypothetical protein
VARIRLDLGDLCELSEEYFATTFVSSSLTWPATQSGLWGVILIYLPRILALPLLSSLARASRADESQARVEQYGSIWEDSYDTAAGLERLGKPPAIGVKTGCAPQGAHCPGEQIAVRSRFGVRPPS